MKPVDKSHKNFTEHEKAEKQSFVESQKEEQHKDSEKAPQDKSATENIKAVSIDEIESLKAQIEELKDKNLRVVAESQNMIKRIKNDHAEAIKGAVSKFASDLTSPIEMLFLALDSIKDGQLDSESQQCKTLYEGVAMTKNEFIKTFNNHGLHRMHPLGEKFDHNFHQAVSQVKDESKEAGTIVQVLKAGYLLNERVISPAVVVVTTK